MARHVAVASAAPRQRCALAAALSSAQSCTSVVSDVFGLLVATGV